MPALIDITGQRFGRLVALEIAGRSNGHVRWRCRCNCGSEIVTQVGHLRSGHTVSCRCRGDTISLRHGEADTRLHRIWRHMRGRCGNPKNDSWRWYGGRGIEVCAEWQTYEGFRDWSLANGYRDDLSIDRWPDQSGDYEPGNCRWATMIEQRQNQRRRKSHG